MVIERATACRMFCEASDTFYLQGQEYADAKGANVFGNRDFLPLGRYSDQVISIEAEVTHSFSDSAEDDRTDYADVYMFRLWSWSNHEEGASVSLFHPWQDFNGDEPPGSQYGWDKLLHEAVARIRSVRFERKPFVPHIVGMPAKA